MVYNDCHRNKQKNTHIGVKRVLSHYNKNKNNNIVSITFAIAINKNNHGFIAFAKAIQPKNCGVIAVAIAITLQHFGCISLVIAINKKNNVVPIVCHRKTQKKNGVIAFAIRITKKALALLRLQSR